MNPSSTETKYLHTWTSDWMQAPLNLSTPSTKTLPHKQQLCCQWLKWNFQIWDGTLRCGLAQALGSLVWVWELYLCEINWLQEHCFRLWFVPKVESHKYVLYFLNAHCNQVFLTRHVQILISRVELLHWLWNDSELSLFCCHGKQRSTGYLFPPLFFRLLIACVWYIRGHSWR